MKRHQTLFSAACLMLFVFNASATVRYVDLNCTNPVSPYTSWATAATNIQDAISFANIGDTVLATNGVYQYGAAVHPGQTQTNRVFVPTGFDLAIRSVNGPLVTAIKGYQVPGTTNGVSAVRCVYLTAFSSLSGFTVTNGATQNANNGGGVSMESSCMVSNCIIVGNAATATGGGACSGNSSCLVNCIISGNTSVNAGGGAFECLLTNCIISANNSPSGGGLGNCTAYNCLVTCNGSTNSIGGSSGGAAYLSTLNNCTIAGNFSHELGAVDACTLNNSIIYYNTNGIYADCYMCKLTNCCTTIGLGTSTLPNNSISNAPGFVNQAAGDYHLTPWSRCVDAGNSTIVNTGTDLDGNPRIVGAAVDMGAYENQSPFQGVAHYVSLNNTNPMTPYTNWLTAATNIQDAVGVAMAGEYVVVDAGAYTNGGTVIYGSETNRVALTNAITLLGLNGAQLTTIVGGTQMRCAYVGSNSVLMGFTLTSGHARTSGDITNEQSGGGVWSEIGGTVSNSLIVGNFAVSGRGGGVYGGTIFNSTLTNNTAGFGGGAASASLFNCLLVTNTAQISAYGGGVYQGTVSNCTLTANWAYFGGGGAYQSTLYNCVLNSNSVSMAGGGAQSSVLFNCTLRGNIGTAVSQCTNYNCILVGNSGSQGAGMNGGIAYNCILSNNTASVFGGGAYQGTLYNCTVIGNSASSGGGTYGSTLYNSILYYNSAPSGSNYSSGVGGGFNYCCTMPLPVGPYPGCFTNAPVFVNLAGGDLHQQTNSPCINGGLNYNVTNLAKITNDFDGNPRIVGGTVDIGAYEYQGSNLGLPIPIPWLRQYNLPIDGSANYADTDGDGLNNWQEWIAGTIPTDATSVLQLSSLSNSVSGMTVTWQSVTNVIYYLQGSTNLSAQPAFTCIQSNIVGHAGSTSYTGTTATNGGPYFYRVGVQ